MRLYTLLLPSLAFAPALLAQRIPEAAVHNTAGTAQPCPIGAQIDANLVAGDNDWYGFTVGASTRVRIHTSSPLSSAVPAGADTRIALLDGTGTTYLAIDDDGRGSTTSNFASDLTLNVAAGSYKVLVVGFGATSAGPYSFEVSELTPVVYDGVEAEATPGANDSHLTAISTGTLGSGVKRFLGNLAPNATVLADTVAAAPAATVFSGGSVVGSVVFLGATSTPTGVASTTTVTQAVTSLPAANPQLSSYAAPASTMSLLFTSGANTGLSRVITASTVFTLTTAAFPAAAAVSDNFQIITGPNTTTNTWVASLPMSGLFVGGSAYSMRMTSGVNVGLSRAITANTGPSAFGSVVTTAAFPAANAPGDTFDIDMTVTTTTVFKAAAALVPNAWSPTTGGNTLGQYTVRFTSGANNGVIRQIAGNTGSTITLNSALTAAPLAGDSYVVEKVDCDYYQIVLTAPFTGFWHQINEGDAPAVFGHRYELYDASGNALLPVGATQMPSFGTQNATCSTLAARTSSARVLPAGTYYLSVRQPPTPFVASTTMPLGVVSTGNYMLEIFTMPMDTAGIVTETEATGGPNSNNTAATATPIATGQVGKGNLTLSTGADATDWWGPLTIATPGTITIQTRRGTTLTPMLDTTVNLRDAAGNLLLGVTGGNVLDAPWTSTSLHARTTVSFFLTPQTFYIEVASPGTTVATQQGDYELEVSSIIDAPYVAASFATAAVNGPACSSTTALADVAAAGSTTTSIVPTAALTANAYINGSYSLRFTSGANAGLFRLISANTATSVTVAAFPVAPTAGDTYQIISSPTLIRQFPSEVPAMGSLFARQLVGCPSFAIYVHMIGFSNTLYAGSIPLPLDLTAIGAPGCTLNVDAVLLNVGLADVTGAADILTPLPPVTAFRGFVWYEQAVVNNPSANAFGAGLSNYGRVITGERSF